MRGNKNGFVLLVVLWGLGLIALLITSFASNSRIRLQASYNQAYAEKALLVVGGIINLTSTNLLVDSFTALAQPNQNIYDNKPKFCTFGDAAISVSIGSEVGKIDLNFASRELLIRAFTGFGQKQADAERISDNIIDFRTDKNGLIMPSLSGQQKPFLPKNSIFESVLELDQVEGIDPILFNKITQFFTVHSRNIGIDPLTAPPGLFSILTGAKSELVEELLNKPFSNSLDRNDSRFPNEFRSTGSSRAYTIHVEAVLATGQSSARDAIVELNLDTGAPFVIRELRRGKLYYYQELYNVLSRKSDYLSPCI